MADDVEFLKMAAIAQASLDELSALSAFMQQLAVILDLDPGESSCLEILARARELSAASALPLTGPQT